MAQDNSLLLLDNQSQHKKKQFGSLYFEDELKILPKSDWQNEEYKHKRTMLLEKDHKNSAA